MPPRDLLAWLEDIREAIAAIQTAVAGIELESYCSNRQIRSAVEREFLLIGEALRQVLIAEPSLETRITAARDVISFRNHLAHGYFAISNETVWGIIEGHLPILNAEIEAIWIERTGEEAPQ